LIEYLVLQLSSDGVAALVTILLHCPYVRIHSRVIFKNTVGQISIFDKTGN